MTRSIARGFRTEYWATRLIQRSYRGHMTRKRVMVLRHKYLNACIQFRNLAVRCVVIVHARRRKLVIILIQVTHLSVLPLLYTLVVSITIVRLLWYTF